MPQLDSRRVVHGEQSIEFLKPLPVSSEGRELELRAKVVGVYDKEKPGTVIETEHLLVEKGSGEVFSRAVGSSFFVGQGGWGGPKGELWFFFVSLGCCCFLSIGLLMTVRRTEDGQLSAARGQGAGF